MAAENKIQLPEWASRITVLRRNLGISQGQLARQMECSAMTISRWERGLQPPSAEFFIQLGKLGGGRECWFFWECAGLRLVDFARALPSKRASESSTKGPTENAAAGSGNSGLATSGKKTIALRLLKTVAGSHGTHGHKKIHMRGPSTGLLGVPCEWCPHPLYTSLLHVRGHSMEPLIQDGDILAVDSFQKEASELDGKIVIVSHKEKGLCVSRLRRYESVNVLQAENRAYEGIVLGKISGWKIEAKVLWWFTPAPGVAPFGGV